MVAISYRHCITYLKVAKKINFKSSDQEKKKNNYGWQLMLSKPIVIIFQFNSVTQWCLTFCDPMNCSTPGLPGHNQLPESTQTHVH